MRRSGDNKEQGSTRGKGPRSDPLQCTKNTFNNTFTTKRYATSQRLYHTSTNNIPTRPNTKKVQRTLHTSPLHLHNGSNHTLYTKSQANTILHTNRKMLPHTTHRTRQHGGRTPTLNTRVHNIRHKRNTNMSFTIYTTQTYHTKQTTNQQHQSTNDATNHKRPIILTI